MSNDIFNIGLSGLNAAQWGLQTTSQNISNASTPGYTVENPVYAEASGQYTGSGFLGGGVDDRNGAPQLQPISEHATEQRDVDGQCAIDQLCDGLAVEQSESAARRPVSPRRITAYFTGLQNVSNNANQHCHAPDGDERGANARDPVQLRRRAIRSAAHERQSAIADGRVADQHYSSQIATLNSADRRRVGSRPAAEPAARPARPGRREFVAASGRICRAELSGYSVFIGNGQPLVVAGQNFNLGTATSQSDPSELAVTYNGLAGATTPPPVEYCLVRADRRHRRWPTAVPQPDSRPG